MLLRKTSRIPWYKLTHAERLERSKAFYQESSRRFNEIQKLNLLKKIAEKLK